MGDLQTDYLTKSSLDYLNNTINDLIKATQSIKKDYIIESKKLSTQEKLQKSLVKYYKRTATAAEDSIERPTIPKIVEYREPSLPSIAEENIISNIKKTEKEITSKISAAAALLGAGVGTFALDEFEGEGSYAESDTYIGPTGDFDGQQTGLNMHLPGGIGTPIYAPIDLIYMQKGTDGLPAVGLQGTADAKGSSGSGFGYYASYRFMKDGRQYEVVLGHFASMAYKGSRDNEVIPNGTLLGYQGASGRSVRGDGSGKPYPHISLHVNGIGFTASDGVLIWFANLLAGAKGTAAPTTKKQEVPQQVSFNTGGSRRIIAVVNNEQTSFQAPQKMIASNTSLNKNYTNIGEVLLVHTTFNLG